MKKRKKDIIYNTFRVIVSIGILIYLVSVFQWERGAEVFARVRVSYLWPAPLLVALALYFGGVRWSILLQYFGICLKAIKAFLYYLIGSFYGIVLPGVIGGDAVRIGICAATKKKSVAVVTATVLIERVCGILVLLAMGTVAVAVLTPDLRSAIGPSVVILVPMLAVLLLIVIFGGYLFFGRALVTWLKNISGRYSKIAETILRIIHHTRKIRSESMVAIFLFSTLFQFTDILASFFLARAININVSLFIFLAIFPIVYILTVLPISLGGLGVREGTLAYLLTRVGVVPSDAVMLSFLIYLNRVLVSLIGGALQVFWKPEAGLKCRAIKAEREAEDIVL